ncbi:hypothetical protein NSTC745_03105 [Nostoc sp. DSM 114161]|jgi:5-methylcytosine-specific restriction endonuclease McrA
MDKDDNNLLGAIAGAVGAAAGANDMSNLQTLCFECNRGKGANS